jgi:hypothetical protein
VFDRLKALLSRQPVSEETKGVIAKATTARELLHGLDALHTRNEMEFNEVTREIEKLEQIERTEAEKIRGGSLSDRRKRNALLKIRRLRKQMENLDNRLKIFDRNMSLHLNLIGKVQEMEAMSLRGLDEKKIDSIMIDFEEKLEAYMNSMASAQVVEESTPIPDVATEKELREIEQEVVQEAEEAEKAERQKEEASREESLEELERKIMQPAPPAREEPEAKRQLEGE